MLYFPVKKVLIPKNGETKKKLFKICVVWFAYVSRKIRVEFKFMFGCKIFFRNNLLFPFRCGNKGNEKKWWENRYKMTVYLKYSCCYLSTNAITVNSYQIFFVHSCWRWVNYNYHKNKNELFHQIQLAKKKQCVNNRVVQKYKVYQRENN